MLRIDGLVGSAFPKPITLELREGELIGDLVGQGVGILLIFSEMPELIGLSDRVAVMHEGELQGILPRAEATQERIMELAPRFNA